jgi:hypothetical protein
MSVQDRLRAEMLARSKLPPEVIDPPLCAGSAHRKRGPSGPCLQRALHGSAYCYYHQPGNERKFGQGYGTRKALEGRA